MRKLLIAAIVLILTVSSLVSVAAVSAVVHRRSHADFIREASWHQTRAHYMFAAQVTPLPPAEAPVQPIPPPLDDYLTDEYWRARDAFRLGQALRIAPEDVVRDAIVVFGDATVAGRVRGDLVVIFGTARIESTAQIDGDFVVIGGGGTVQPGATAARDVVVIGGTLDAPPGFAAGGGHIVIGSQILGGSLTAIVPYLSRGPLWGRLIVPDLPWVWGVLALFFLLYAALNLVFDRPVLACATTLRNRPLTAFGAGLLVLLLIGPVCLLLAISVIGIAVVPFVICGLIAAGLVGKVALARWIGMSAVQEDPDGNRAHAARSFVLGFAVLSITYMIPVLGIITWAIGSVMGLGSAAMSFMAGYRRENPAKTPAFVPPRPPAGPPASATVFPPPSTADGMSAASDTPAARHAEIPPIESIPGVQPPPYNFSTAPAASMPFVAAAGLLITQPRARFRDRLAAFALDLILIFISSAFLDSITYSIDGPEVFFPFLLMYMVAFWTIKQTTVGGIICNIRLVRVDGTPLSFADALVRGLAGIFSLAVPPALGALWIIRDPERQAWHDKIAGTYVVKVPRNWPL